MKAAIVRAFGPIDALAIEQRPDPVPGPGEVVVEIAAADVNYPDLLVVEGKYQVKPPLPFSPGKAGAGRVLRCGPGVDGLAVGARVTFEVEYGAYAEQVSVRAENCFLAYQTAYFALRERAALAPGETVLVLAATGAVGIASMQLAKVFGAAAVIAGVRDQADAASLARANGADHVVGIASADVRERLKDEIAALTRGRGIDVVIDPIGGDAHAAALRALAWRGRLVIVGFASGEIPEIWANYLLVKNIAVLGLQWSDYRDRAAAQVAVAQREIFALHLDGRLAPVIARRFKLDQARDALRALREGGTRGKIILDVGQG